MHARHLLLSLTFALPAAGLFAQGVTDAAAKKLDGVRATFAQLLELRKEQQEAMGKLRGLERGSEEQKRVMAELTAMRSKLTEPQKAFAESFAAVDWKGFDVVKDADLLKDGLVTLARDLDRPEAAVAAGRYFLENFKGERAAETVRGSALPMALLAVGESDAAREMLAEQVAGAEGVAKARALLSLGDVEAACGDIEGARARYVEAEPLADERTMGYVTLRKELIGKPAPDIDSSTWIGGEAGSLGGLKGNVVLVDFWATWCGPCRAVMPALNELYAKHKDEGLRVIGVTRFYDHGYLPADPSQMGSGGESVRDIKPADFEGHVAAFREHSGIRYPFVIGVEQDFKNYFVRGIPTLAVVDRAGKIALITVGSGSEGLLKFAVGNLLARDRK